MFSEPLVIGLNKGKAPDDWRRFLAVLCFIQFYIQFVCKGYSLWCSLGYWVGSEYEYNLFYLFSHIVGFLRAIAFWGFGRALWRNKPFASCWLIVIVASSIMSFYVGILELANYDLGGSVHWAWFGFEIKQIIARAIELAIEHLRWFLLLVVGMVYLLRPRRWEASARRPWDMLAVACSLAVSIENLCLGEWSWWSNIEREAIIIFSLRLSPWLSIAHIIMPLLTTIVLYLCFRISGLFAMILVAGETLAVFCTLRWCLPPSMQSDGSFPYILNTGFFFNFFVWWVYYAGPWLLIAIYCCRVPMRLPSDDGSPFPRYYCNRCRYNLHGLEIQQCPECGQFFKAGLGTKWIWGEAR